MADRPPYMPTGIGMGMLGDDETKIGVLIFETAKGNFDFAINQQAVDVIRKALSKIETHLTNGKISDVDQPVKPFYAADVSWQRPAKDKRRTANHECRQPEARTPRSAGAVARGLADWFRSPR
ncbi:MULTISPECIES: hypothetical protein [unclassified Mesorhizobium]|uniref:hypothetical protein n=1 Tax=unclassified Mesorhizobium TaxID=325217 RepID=UPI001CC9B7BD|nr:MULTISPECIES: hypothetical protein [unclassified Mesorhizobium]MBZ9683859.1 hypothetical protein [Mesorhizobium sp. CO1-1-2]MBZ9725414.1 hypothetical protein [Mesorhizobium sp. CO1-1-11]MBZ9923651.1 hypothetical protein [Mesorhizobium sp. BR1-1-4]